MMPKLFFLLMVALLLFSAPAHAEAESVGAAKTVHQLVGEDYRYTIDFLFFTNLAEGELRLSKTDQENVYRAELIGRTLGIASWLAGNRTQSYASLMELTANGSFRSIEHTAKVVKRRWRKTKKRSRLYSYDYALGKVVDEKIKEGKQYSKDEHAIPEGSQPVDMLAGFYNLRLGVYGPLVRGSKIQIPVYAKGRFTEITVNVLSVEQQAKRKYFPSHGLLVLATMDPEIFENDSGNLYVWFNDAGIPERGIVEDIIGMGDVKGYLVEGL